MARPLIYNAFTMNTGSHINHGLWRHPETRQRDFNDLSVWTDLAKLLERGRFDAIFLADVVGLYGDYRGGWETYVKEGLQIPSNDPSVLISALAGVTENIGLAFTSSVIQAPPSSSRAGSRRSTTSPRAGSAGTSSPTSRRTPTATSVSTG